MAFRRWRVGQRDDYRKVRPKLRGSVRLTMREVMWSVGEGTFAVGFFARPLPLPTSQGIAVTTVSYPV